MTRADHPRRVAYVLRIARRSARRGQGLQQVAKRLGMPPRVLRRFLVRHGAGVEAETLSHLDSFGAA